MAITGTVPSGSLDPRKGLRAQDYLIDPKRIASDLINSWLIDTGCEHILKRTGNDVRELEARISCAVREAYGRGQAQSNLSTEQVQTIQRYVDGMSRTAEDLRHGTTMSPSNVRNVITNVVTMLEGILPAPREERDMTVDEEYHDFRQRVAKALSCEDDNTIILETISDWRQDRG